jgi:hypothetical protein
MFCMISAKTKFQIATLSIVILFTLSIMYPLYHFYGRGDFLMDYLYLVGLPLSSIAMILSTEFLIREAEES